MAATNEQLRMATMERRARDNAMGRGIDKAIDNARQRGMQNPLDAPPAGSDGSGMPNPIDLPKAALESTEPNEPQDSVPGRGLWNQIRRAEASIKLDQSILHLMLDTLECLDKPRGSVVSPIATDGIQDVISRLALQTREAVDEIRDLL